MAAPERRGGPDISTRPPLKVHSSKVPPAGVLSRRDLLELQRLAGNRRVLDLLSGPSAPKKDGIRTQPVQRFIVLATKQNPVPIENGSYPYGLVYVFGAWRKFEPARWSSDLPYRNWIVSGWNEGAEGYVPEPQPPLNSSELGMLMLRMQEIFAQQQRTQQQNRPSQPHPAQTAQEPDEVADTAMELGHQSPPGFEIKQVGGDDQEVLNEIERWQAYVDKALAESPQNESLWQLQSSKTVLESIRSNLAELIDEDDEDHDFDIAESSRGIEAIIDTTRDGGPFVIENIATNPRNLYTLHGSVPQQTRGAGSTLIKHLVALAIKEGDEVVKLVALSPQHARKYEGLGFRLDATELDSPMEGEIQVPASEIPMVAPVGTLRSHFGL